MRLVGADDAQSTGSEGTYACSLFSKFLLEGHHLLALAACANSQGMSIVSCLFVRVGVLLLLGCFVSNQWVTSINFVSYLGTLTRASDLILKNQPIV